MKSRFMLTAAGLSALSLLTQPLAAGELDPAQQTWFKHYEKQPNLPKPADMLLNTDPEPDLGEGFAPLFNGKDLAGWKSRGGDSTFEAKDGCIVGTCKPGSPSTYLCTEKEDYGDFILTCDMKWDVETNSGIMFRARATGSGQNAVAGPQVEMEPFSQDREWSGGIYGQSCGGWFYPVWLKEHAAARQAQKAEGWNRVTIQAKGPVVKTWLNGVPVAHWKTEAYLKGYFGLQIHKGKQGRVLWTNIRIKTM